MTIIELLKEKGYTYIDSDDYWVEDRKLNEFIIEEDLRDSLERINKGVSRSIFDEIVNKVKPAEEKVIYDTEKKYIDKVRYKDQFFELKQAKEGYTVKSYRLSYLNGVLQNKTLLRTDKYLPQNRVIVYGVETRPKDIEFNENNELKTTSLQCG